MEESFETNRMAKKKVVKSETNLHCQALFVTLFMLVSVIVCSVLYLLITRLGFGKTFPKQDYETSEPILKSSVLEIVASLPFPPGNIAVSSLGDIFFNFHPEFNPLPTKIAKLALDSNTWETFPNMKFQSKIVSCLSMRIDHEDRLWLLDFAKHGFGGTPALYAFDVSRKRASHGTNMIHSYLFPKEIAGAGSMLNDFQVDPSGNCIYIADTGIISLTPALIVYDTVKRKSYRLLSNHPSFIGDSIFMNVSNHNIKFGPLGLRINLDSIALDRDGSNLIFGAVTSDKLYSLSTSHIHYFIKRLDEHGGSSQFMYLENDLASKVTLISSLKPLTDGLSTDLNGNIWMTAFEHSSLAIASVPAGRGFNSNSYAPYTVRKVVQDDKLLRWPDGLSFGPDGLYITNSALHYKFSNMLPSFQSKKKVPIDIFDKKIDNRKLVEYFVNDMEAASFYAQYGPFHILRINNNNLKDICGSSLPPAGH